LEPKLVKIQLWCALKGVHLRNHSGPLPDRITALYLFMDTWRLLLLFYLFYAYPPAQAYYLHRDCMKYKDDVVSIMTEAYRMAELSMNVGWENVQVPEGDDSREKITKDFTARDFYDFWCKLFKFDMHHKR
jgi:hypothetical protein